MHEVDYGRGRDPYCKITDSKDMALPAFGPDAIDSLAEKMPCP
jgi:hypothetical protein